MRTRIVASLVALSVLLICFCAAPARADGGLTAYRDALLGQLDKLEAALPVMTGAAETVAEKLLAGGNLYVAGNDAFVSESFVRAGGIMLIMPYKEQVVFSEHDVLLAGMAMNAYEPAIKACKRAREAGVHVVLFSPEFQRLDAPAAGLCDAHIINFAGPESKTVPQGVGITSPLYNITALWVFTGELVGALTRKGKMPVMWKSVAVPGGRARNASYYVRNEPAKRRFHNDMKIPPQPEGKLGGLYINVVRRQLSGLRGPVLEQLSAAAALMAASVRAGNTVHVQTISHFTTYEVAGTAAPAWVKTDCEARLRGLMKAEQLAQKMAPGDVFFQLGYHQPTSHPYHQDAGYVELLRKAGARTVIVLCHAPDAPLDGPQPDMLIDAQWEYGDSAVALPGYDTKILPGSAVLQTTIFWTVAAQADRLLTHRE